MSALFFARKPEGDLELEFLRTEFSDAQRDLQAAYNQFNLAVEPEQVEACIYQINAIQARCNYLIRVMKSRGAQPRTAAAEIREDALWT